MKSLEYYTADWCAPCRTFGPIMDQLQLEGMNIQRINIDNRQNKAVENNVKTIPTCIIRKDGVEVDRLVGAQRKETVRERYNNA